MYSGAPPDGDAVQRRADPAAFPVDAVALGALNLVLLVKEQLPAGDRIALEVRLPGRLARGPAQGADVLNHVGDLLVLERASPNFFMVDFGTPSRITRARSSSLLPWMKRPRVRSGPLPPRPAPP